MNSPPPSPPSDSWVPSVLSAFQTFKRNKGQLQSVGVVALVLALNAVDLGSELQEDR